MSTPKTILFRGKTLSNGEHPIMLRIYAGKEYRLSLSMSAKSEQWNAKSGRLKRCAENHEQRNAVLRQVEVKADRIIQDMVLRDKPFSFDEFKEIFQDKRKPVTVFTFLQQRVEEFRINKKVGNMRHYTHLKSKLQKFGVSSNLMFVDITYKWLKEFETFLFSIGNGNAGVSNHMRTLRALFNEAIRRNIVDPRFYPFANQFNRNAYSLAHLKSDPSPRPLDEQELRKLKEFNSSNHTQYAVTYDIFMFLLRARGLNFIDLCFLTQQNISGDRLNYERHKTKKQYSIKITPEMWNIINKYSGDKYIFPFLNKATEKDDYFDLYYRTRYALLHFNKDLKEIAKICGINKRMSSYSARYTYTNILVQNNVNIVIIQQALGHSSIATTQHYIQKYSMSEVDKVDSLI